MKAHADRSKGSETWKEWRERALEFLRDRIAGTKREAARNRSAWNGDDRSVLVQIFLWEKDIDRAWLEAQEGGCRESLWLELAAKRERDHPEDALAVYQSLIEPTIMRMNNDAYRVAIGYVKKVGKLLKRLGREDEWNRYLDDLHTKHRRKRNFVALLDKMGG